MARLSIEEQAQAETTSGAIALMMQYPNLIKRPLLQHAGGIALGFDAALYTQLFCE